MEASLLWPLIWACTLLISLAAGWGLMWMYRRTLTELSNQTNLLSKSFQQSLSSQLSQSQQLLSEAGSRELQLSKMLMSRDPMTFQALTAVSATPSGYDEEYFDPTPEGEISRIAARDGGSGEDELNASERAFLSEIGFDDDILGADSSA